jgi:hypothetical protein
MKMVLVPVFILCIDESVWKLSWLLIMEFIKGSLYWHGTCRTSGVLDNIIYTYIHKYVSQNQYRVNNGWIWNRSKYYWLQFIQLHHNKQAVTFFSRYSSHNYVDFPLWSVSLFTVVSYPKIYSIFYNRVRVWIVNGFESVNVTDVDLHIQYERVTPDSFCAPHSGIMGNICISEIHSQNKGLVY